MASIADTFNRGDENLDNSTASGGGTWDEYENTGWVINLNSAKASRVGNFVDQTARLTLVDLDGDDHEVAFFIFAANSAITCASKCPIFVS